MASEVQREVQPVHAWWVPPADERARVSTGNCAERFVMGKDTLPLCEPADRLVRPAPRAAQRERNRERENRVFSFRP